MDYLPYILGGLFIGSFLNVCIWRLPRHISINDPKRSFCTGCNRQLTWWENIPLLSWVALKGKCRTCEAKISWRYPFVEALSAFAAVLSLQFFGLTATGVVIYALTASLIVITFIDFDFKIIPDKISLPGIIVGLLLGTVSEFSDYLQPPVTQGAFDSLLGMLIGGGFFYAIAVLYYVVAQRDGLGGGDIKLMGMTGAILGWKSVAPTIFLGSLFGAGVGIVIMTIDALRHRTVPLKDLFSRLVVSAIVGVVLGTTWLSLLSHFAGPQFLWKENLDLMLKAIVFCLVFGSVFLILQRGDRKLEIPFGPWLALGTVLYVFLDPPIFKF